MKAMITVIEGKGGVGKSTLAALAVDALRQEGKRSVAVIDGDTTNSTMASMFDDVKMVDTAEQEAAGYIAAALKVLADYLVMDVGARAEAGFLRRIAPRLVKARSKQEPMFVVLRPITLFSFVQSNALQWPAPIKVIRSEVWL